MSIFSWVIICFSSVSRLISPFLIFQLQMVKSEIFGVSFSNLGCLIQFLTTGFDQGTVYQFWSLSWNLFQTFLVAFLVSLCIFIFSFSLSPPLSLALRFSLYYQRRHLRGLWYYLSFSIPLLVFSLSLSLSLFLAPSCSFSLHYLLSAQSLLLKNIENANFNFNYI